MKWEMEVYEIEAVLEKIWDLHDKLSDAIHSVSRAHFLKSRNKADDLYNNRSNKKTDNNGDQVKAGYVFVKEFRLDDDESAVHEAKSLNAIRTALEHLEDQLEFFHVTSPSFLFRLLICSFFIIWLLFEIIYPCVEP